MESAILRLSNKRKSRPTYPVEQATDPRRSRRHSEKGNPILLATGAHGRHVSLSTVVRAPIRGIQCQRRGLVKDLGNGALDDPVIILLFGWRRRIFTHLA